MGIRSPWDHRSRWRPSAGFYRFGGDDLGCGGIDKQILECLLPAGIVRLADAVLPEGADAQQRQLAGADQHGRLSWRYINALSGTKSLCSVLFNFVTNNFLALCLQIGMVGGAYEGPAGGMGE